MTSVNGDVHSVRGNPFLFTGQRYDVAIELYYYKARYYDPIDGRFISRDPIGVWGDEGNLGNAYAYVGNNPIMLTDPSGQCPWCIAAIVVGTVGGAIYGGYQYAKNADDDFRMSDFWGSVGVGAASGLSIGLGITVFSTCPTCGAALIGGGIGMGVELRRDLRDGSLDSGWGYVGALGGGACLGAMAVGAPSHLARGYGGLACGALDSLATQVPRALLGDCSVNWTNVVYEAGLYSLIGTAAGRLAIQWPGMKLVISMGANTLLAESQATLADWTSGGNMSLHYGGCAYR